MNNDVDTIAEPLRKALAAYYATDFASTRRVAIAQHVFGFAGSLLMPQLDELARNVRLESADNARKEAR